MSTYCKHCGAKLTPGQAHDCPKKLNWNKIKVFFEKLFNKIGSNESLDDAKCFERGKSIVPDTVAPDDGEVVIKQYDLAILRSRLKATKAEGKMQVTNKRILFRAAGRTPVGKTVYQSEFDIARIEGVEIRKDYRFILLDFFISMSLYGFFILLGTAVGALFAGSEKMFWCVTALLLGLATSIPCFIVRKKYLLKMMSTGIGTGLIASVLTFAIDMGSKGLETFGIISIIYIFVLFAISMFLSFFKPNLSVELKSSGGMSAVQIKHRYASFFIWKKMEENSGFAEILPGKDADLAIKEIGAMINDIKTLGDIGIEKWQTK